MSKIVYAATSIEKMVSSWSPTEGAGTKPWCTILEKINVEASSLNELLKKLEGRFLVSFKPVYVHQHFDDQPATHIGTNQVETNDGLEPDENEKAEWEAGRLKLYLCDYTFGVEKRVTGPIDPVEFADSDIETY